MRSPRETLPEHLAIIEALVHKDPEKSEQTARRHLKRSWEKLFREFEREMKSRSQKGRGAKLCQLSILKRNANFRLKMKRVK